MKDLSRALWLVLILLLTSLVSAQEKVTSSTEPVSAYMERKMAELNLVGAGIGILHPDGTTWIKGFGMANLERGIPASGDTVAMWASCSKVVTGAAAMKVLQSKRIPLDASVNPYLPFPVENPNFPQAAITFRMLLTHTSSLLYDVRTGQTLYASGDPTMPLGEFLREYLVPGGRYYKLTNYSTAAPGSAWVYSNINASLLAYLVERITRMSFPEYSRKALFQPLGVKEAGWYLRGLDALHLAIQYRPPQSEGKTRAVEHYSWPGYADGGLRCSARTMLRFLSAMAGGGRLDGKQVLQREIVTAMLTPQGIDPTQLKSRNPIVSLDTGLVWRLLDVDGRRIWSHNGNGSGMATLLLLDDKTRSAAVVWISGGVLETAAGQVFFADLHHRLVTEMERSRPAQ